MGDVRLSNVIGAPFSEYVITQFNLRAYHNSTGTGNTPGRTNEEVLFLANKTGWAKLTSSVRILPSQNETLEQFYRKLGLESTYLTSEDLAKNWILEAGTSIGNGTGINLRRGIGPEGAYGLGGTEELGYRPMPGLTSVVVDTKGTLGSLREAIINFKVWNLNQLNVVEALYFRLGYSMLLEWGHTQFFSNVNQVGGSRTGTFTTNTYGIDPFKKLRKEVIQQSIGKRGKELSGNYDAMLGVVTNFTWSFNQEGGYDCTVKLIGLGAIIDSLRINLSYKMPDVIFEDYQYQQQLIRARLEEEAARRAQTEEQDRRKAQGLPPTLPALPTSANEIYTNIYVNDLGTPNPPLSQEAFLNQNYFYTANPNNPGVNIVYDYYYKATTGGNPANAAFKSELNTTRTGLFLSTLLGIRNKWQVLFADAPTPISLSDRVLTTAATKSTTLEPDPVLDANRNYPVFDNGLAGGPYGAGDLAKASGTNNFVKLFDLRVRDSKNDSVAQGLNSLTNQKVDLDELVFPTYSFRGNNLLENVVAGVASAIPGVTSAALNINEFIEMRLAYKAQVKNTSGQTLTKVFNVVLRYKPLPFSEDPVIVKNRPTRKELTNALQTWFNNGRKVRVTQIETFKEQARSVVVRGVLIDIAIPNKSNPEFTIEFDNSATIQTVLPPEPAQQQPQQQQAQPANSGDQGGTENTPATEQTDQSQRFASALHAMLSAVKSKVQTKSLSVPQNQSVYTDSLVDLTSTLYRDGVLDGIFNYTPPSALDPRESAVTFNLKAYAAKGFNSNLMSDPELYAKVKNVDFKSLATAYAIRYTVKGEESKINFPIYIKFGYLLSFLNNMCLVYDSTQDTDKHPYVYLDFNPETNFCLSSPQHLSVDPLVCMIPFEGNGLSNYLKLYPAALQESVKSKASPLFSPTTNAVSSLLNTFKTAENAYQGKTMEILLNVNFLLDVLNEYTTKDPEHSVNLKGFLDAIITGVNKALGNFNLLRVAYRDESNTVVIKDDQFVPPAGDEDFMLDREKFLAPGTRGIPKYGQLPVFGSGSLVREMEFKTNLTTNISNVIAISAQANVGSANSTDYSPYSYLNINYQDAYKPTVTDSTGVKTQQRADTTGSVANDLTQALQFNNHLLNVYYNGQLSKPKIDFAKNYYIERMSKIKSEDEVTVSAPFIPANLSITVDGISGIVMGNAFTIPEDRLPLSLKGNKNSTKVGFVVVGLTHTIDRNQWLTKIRGQMIKLRDVVRYQAPGKLEKIEPRFIDEIGGEGVTTAAGCKTVYPNLEIKDTVQVETYPISKAAAYLKANHPDVGRAAFAVMLAEASTAGDNFRSAGGNNFGGVQTDAGVWGFGNFNGQFCRRDSGGQLRMFASFTTPEAFLDFLANRLKAKGFSSTSGAENWTTKYINNWWSPVEKFSYVKGSTVFNTKLSIFNRASILYDRA